MDAGAVARRREEDFSRALARVGDERLDGLRGQAWRHDHQVGHDGEQRHRRQILGRIEGHRLVDRRIDGHQAGRRQQHRGAVGRRLGDRVAADVAPGAGAVLDHDRLAKALGHLLADDAAQHVDRAAGRERDDQAQGFGGKRLGGVRGAGPQHPTRQRGTPCRRPHAPQPRPTGGTAAAPRRMDGTRRPRSAAARSRCQGRSIGHDRKKPLARGSAPVRLEVAARW